MMNTGIFFEFVLALTLIHRTNAYSAQTFDCSDEDPVYSLKGIDDSLKAGETVFYTNESSATVSNCSSILNVAKRNDNQTGLNITLNTDLGSYCVDNSVNCKLKCDGKTEISITGVVARNLQYDILFEEHNYTARVEENVKKGYHVRLDKTLSVRIGNCSDGAELIKSYFGRFNLSTVKVAALPPPFNWGAETNADSLFVNGPIDFETTNFYHVVIEAIMANSRNEKLNGHATVDLYIYVIDVDDNNPIFNVSLYNLTVIEGNSSFVNTSLIATPPIHAYDPDFGINEIIKYSIPDQEDSGLFVIEDNGSIKVTKKLDYEKKSKYSILIKAAQKDKPDTATALATLQVNVIDIDDNDPTFIQKNYTCSINEHSSVGSIICTITAIDNDTTPENTNFSYHVWSDNLPIKISKTGEIIVSNMTALDRETIGKNLIFQVGTKKPSGEYTDNATVDIVLIDINDNSPKFTQDSYHFNLNNSTKNDVVGTVHAEDDDEGINSKITYSLLPVVSSSSCSSSQSSSKLFSLNSTSGEISFAAVGFCETYELTVQACDNGVNRRCNFTTVKITTASDGKARALNQLVSVVEESPKNTNIELVECTAVGHDYVYIGGHEFEIDSNTGMLKNKLVLDREKNDSYNFLVNVTSSNKVLCVVNVTVTVEDINDNTPLFVDQPYQFALSTSPQDGDFVGTIKALDIDISENGNVSYFLEHQSTQPFRIDQNSGNVTISHADRITDDIMELYVIAQDNGRPPRQNHTIVYITGETSLNLVPISTPLTVEHIKRIQEQLERSVTNILDTAIEIVNVEEVMNKSSSYKSRIHIKTTQNTTVSRATFLSRVLANYEDIRSLFYQSSANTGTEPRKSGIGPSEIGLIVMAAVILIGAILAIVIIHRQFSSQKKYKQLYDSLTKNSSLYESQEIAITICDDEPECNGTVQNQDVNENDLTATPNLAITAINPSYTPDSEETIIADLNGHASETGENENTDVKTDSIGKENDDDDKSLNKETDTSSPIVYANVNSEGPHDYENTNVVNAHIEPDTDNGEVEETQVSKSNDLMTFDSESSDGANEQMDKESEEKTEIEDIDDEPKPDYNDKKVRFHSEVLDADENKLEPLNVKSEDSVDTDSPEAAEEIEETEDANDEENDVNDNGDISDTGSNADIQNVNMDSLDSNENEESMHNSTDDTERLEEEIVAPGMPYDENIQDEFYFGEIKSTHF